MADWFATLIMLAGLVIVLFPGTLSEAAGPRLNASPTTALPGDVLHVSGRGFPARATLRLAWDGSVISMGPVRVNRFGTFQSDVSVAALSPGDHTLTAVGIVGSTRSIGSRPIASVAITVSAPAAAVVAAEEPSVAPALPPPPEPQAATPTAQPTAAPPPPTAAPPPPTAPTTPTAGLPSINASYGTVFRKVFTDGSLGPFRVMTYPDDHIGGSGQFMTVFNRFTPGKASVHDGYLDLRATRRSDGLWSATLVGTSQAGNGPTFGYGVYRFWLRFNAAPATWQAAWLYDTTSWSATEIDFPEMLEGMSLTAHVLGQGAGAAYGLPRPGDLASVFHEFKIERRAGFVAYSIDGREVARINGAMPASKLAILLDSKVGFPWAGAAGAPTGNTPDTVYLHVAAVTVDP